MKRFDYNNAYLNIKHEDKPVSEEQPVAKPVKQVSVRESIDAPAKVSVTPEQKAVEKSNAEKAKAQDDVNDVLYQDSRPKRSITRVVKSSGDSSDSSTTNEDIDESVVSSDEFEDNENMEANDDSLDDDNVVGESGRDSYMSDSLVDDFKNNFDNGTDDDVVLVRPGDVSVSHHASAHFDEHVDSQVSGDDFETDVKFNPKYAPNDSSSATIVDKRNISVGQPKIYTELAERVQTMFPSAAGAADAINAYLYIKLGYPSDVAISKQLKDVVDSYVGDGSDDYYIESDMNDLLEKVVTLQSNDKAVMHKLELLEVLTAYLLCEYNAYIVVDRGGNSRKGPGDLKLCNSHVQELINNLESIGASDLANWRIGKTSRSSASGRRMK